MFPSAVSFIDIDVVKVLGQRRHLKIMTLPLCNSLHLPIHKHLCMNREEGKWQMRKCLLLNTLCWLPVCIKFHQQIILSTKWEVQSLWYTLPSYRCYYQPIRLRISSQQGMAQPSQLCSPHMDRQITLTKLARYCRKVPCHSVVVKTTEVQK